MIDSSSQTVVALSDCAKFSGHTVLTIFHLMTMIRKLVVGEVDCSGFDDGPLMTARMHSSVGSCLCGLTLFIA